MTQVRDLLISDLRPSEDNPRRDAGDVKELAASIASQGIIEPLVVTPDGDGIFVVVAGSRRLAAAKVAKLATVPCIVRDLDARAQAEIALIENLQREDLAPMDEANALAKLMELGEYSQRDLATRIGRSQAHISKRLALLELPAPAKKALDSGGITVTDAIELTKLKDHPDRVTEVLKEVKEEERIGAGPGDVDVEAIVKQQLEDQRRQEMYTELLAKAKAKKDVPFVELEGDLDRYTSPSLPKGHAFLQHGYPSIGWTVKQHAKEPCHAITVVQHRYADPEIAYLCTDPKRHPKKKENSERTQDTRAKKKREHDREKKKAQGRRRQFVAGLLKKRLPKGQVLEHIAKGLILDARHDRQRIASNLLGLEVPAKKSRYMSAYQDFEKALLAEAAKGETHLLRVALAVALASYEETAGATWGSRSGLKNYFAFLTRHGYRRSDPERLELEGKAPRA